MLFLQDDTWNDVKFFKPFVQGRIIEVQLIYMEIFSDIITSIIGTSFWIKINSFSVMVRINEFFEINFKSQW